MAQITLEVDELSEEQVELVKNMIAWLRSANQKKAEQARSQMQMLWLQLKNTDSANLNEAECGQRVEKPVAR